MATTDITTFVPLTAIQGSRGMSFQSLRAHLFPSEPSIRWFADWALLNAFLPTRTYRVEYESVDKLTKDAMVKEVNAETDCAAKIRLATSDSDKAAGIEFRRIWRSEFEVQKESSVWKISRVQPREVAITWDSSS